MSRAEAELWRAVVVGAVPLPGRALPPEEPPPANVAADPPPPPAVPRPLPVPPPPRALPALTHGRPADVDKRTGERLRRGRMAIDARIDLHGMTQDAAHAALGGFIGRSHQSGHRCVLVITGKGLREGTGVLRAAVPRWLNEPHVRAAVLGFSHAQPRDGGEGALYVLLKRRR